MQIIGRYLRDSEIEPVGHGMSDNNRTLYEASLYTRIFVGDQFMGAWETYSVDQNTGSDHEGQGGNDWQEAKPGDRFWTWSYTRRRIRGKTLEDKVYELYKGGKLADIDFRVLPFDLTFHQFYQSPSGNTTYQDEAETIFDCHVQQYIVSPTDKKGWREERVSGWARGHRRFGQNVTEFLTNPGLHTTRATDANIKLVKLGGQ